MKNLLTNIRLWFIWLFNPIAVDPTFILNLLEESFPWFSFEETYRDKYRYDSHFIEIKANAHYFLPVEYILRITIKAGTSIVYSLDDGQSVHKDNLVTFLKSLKNSLSYIRR